MHILIIDNNDSFTRNLEHLLMASISGPSGGEAYAHWRNLIGTPD